MFLLIFKNCFCSLEDFTFKVIANHYLCKKSVDTLAKLLVLFTPTRNAADERGGWRGVPGTTISKHLTKKDFSTMSSFWSA